MPCTLEKNAGGIPGLIVISQRQFPDNRGFFVEIAKESDLVAAGIPSLVQINGPQTKKGGFRGLHFQQPPNAQGKLIAVMHGTIYDVAVDIRVGSPTYGKWFGIELSRENGKQLWIPAGFAHGFVSLSLSDVVYGMADAEYAPESDRGVLWNDPEIGIKWPMTPNKFSDKDLRLPLFGELESPFTFGA